MKNAYNVRALCYSGWELWQGRRRISGNIFNKKTETFAFGQQG